MDRACSTALRASMGLQKRAFITLSTCWKNAVKSLPSHSGLQAAGDLAVWLSSTHWLILQDHTHTHTGLACCSSPSFHWYSQHLPTEGWPGWVDLCSWLHSHFPSLPIVMHLSTNHTQSWSASDVEFLECFWNYSEKIVMSPGSTKSNFVDQDQNVAIRPRCLIFTYHMAHNTVNIHETSSSTV